MNSREPRLSDRVETTSSSGARPAPRSAGTVPGGYSEPRRPSHTNQAMLRMHTMALTHALIRTPKISLAGSMRMFSKKKRPNV